MWPLSLFPFYMLNPTLRPAGGDHQKFLCGLYYAIREPEFAALPWPDEQKRGLIDMQFRAQLSAYTAQYPDSGYQIIEVNGGPVGKVWIAELRNEYQLVDIALLPNFQGAGIGSEVIRRLQAEAGRTGLPIRSTVFRFNQGSLRFHQRLGFAVIAEDQLHYSMEWRPATDCAAKSTSGRKAVA